MTSCRFGYAAHPRSRGENCRASWSTSSLRGSSPLTRGKRDRRETEGQAQRLIPAHAGKTSSSLGPVRPAWAHPRSRGENVVLSWAGEAGMGSSPLTRGKQRGALDRCKGIGLIPAHAGKTQRGVEVFQCTTAHPRSRGENAPPALSKALDTGSSPLTRGKPRLYRRCQHIGGLIPAHAGKTGRVTRLYRHESAHPRSRGKNRRLIAPSDATLGSSPLTRGKLDRLVNGSGVAGLIPAHAGKT